HFIKAFTHMSYINESRMFGSESYERYEFLGDSILDKIITTYIFDKFEELDPGELTLLRSHVVNKHYLASISRKLNFQDYILVGNGDQKQTISESVFEDVFEAIIGAIYLDSGEEEATKFVKKQILDKIQYIDFDNLKDHKTKLQELLQSEKRKAVEYKTISQKRGPKGTIFVVNALFEGNVFGRGKGSSKKEAEQHAAKDAYKKLAK
ncbi:MAG: ribonuclease III, partial [Tenericutes bacterium]